ncbi:MAG: hypothetical protein HQM13_22695 [SAR324 cluster bacterium]|nr:hypothetical protein [SAR324 cluster bacterium]
MLHYYTFKQFFPNAQGRLGHDHSYNFPLLLDGYYWFLKNGFFSIPWFTPSFCGGMPLFANPATFYLSFPQYMSFFVDPLSSIKLTFILFAGIGFWGTFCLLTHIFRTRVWTALLGATLFLFNGFYTYRLIIGHLEFHAFMLVPLFAYFLLKPKRTRTIPWSWLPARDMIINVLLLTYMFYSGMTQMIIPSMISVIAIAFILGISGNPHFDFKSFSFKFVLIGVFSLCLSASKLVGALSFLSHFPRTSYLLPGVEGVIKLFVLVSKILALGGVSVVSQEGLTNNQWLMSRHEYEFGITIVPFLIIGSGLLSAIWTIRSFRGLRIKSCFYCFGLLLLLLIPFLLNFYSPAWNQVLKNIPIVQNLSSLLRWFIIYIPIVILLAALAMEKTPWLSRHGQFVALAGISMILFLNMTTEKGFYHNEEYEVKPILEAYAHAKISQKPPTINNIAASLNEKGKTKFSLGRNNAIVQGYSQIICYEPMFGYRLEFLPFKTIRIGPTLLENDGLLNIKNPACYLYPRENQCTPGDQFRVDQKKEAENFINFQPFQYEISTAQKVANWLNLGTLAIAILALAAYCIFKIRLMLQSL